MYRCKTDIERCQYLLPLYQKFEEMYIGVYGINGKRKAIKNSLRRSINYILVNCMYILADGETEGIISLNRNLYSHIIVNGKKENVKISYCYVMNLLELLEMKGYITLTKGKRTKGKTCKSYISIKRELEEQLKLYLPKLKKKIDSNCLILRVNSEVLKYKACRSTKQIIDDVWEYNAFLFKNPIDYPAKNVKYILKFNRIFNNDFDHGGRYYEQSGLIQGLPSSERCKILINGNSVIEADFKYLHIALLYKEKILNNFDPYIINPCNLGLKDTPEIRQQLREFCKPSLNTLLNGRSYQECLGSIRHEFNEEKKSGGLSLLPNDLNIKKLISLIKEHNYKIKEHFNSGVGLILQRKDSDIANLVINHFTKKGIVVVPIHDSFLIEEKYKNELIFIMRESYKKIKGDSVNCKIEVK
ncbi:hypothetical protein SOASR032_26200 [Pragia fontium]|uniref:Uncharacterized protein n=1 Tax=Pragia fontium TaxID=82985 RepID=A0ABQ5LKA5_9GAMM|nr:hypothetical protein [Pragia fontium]GKX64051.1 hypothetical protein SOASR032_26200 [Pragia fontium]